MEHLVMVDSRNGFIVLCKKDHAFQSKLNLWISHIMKKSLLHFPRLKKVIIETADENVFDPQPFMQHLEKLQQEFSLRFQEFNTIVPIVKFIVNPFSTVDVSETAIIIEKYDIILQSHAKDDNFWKLIDKNKYPLLSSAALRINCCYGSTYLCESLFANMKYVNSSYNPDFNMLVEEVQCQ
uniref:HAT C-terminal dimerisation domain-containing protein n=1 Tax=Callorhinchus milii TaxID=7868 RepID=A0A4W3HRD2_CALMI